MGVHRIAIATPFAGPPVTWAVENDAGGIALVDTGAHGAAASDALAGGLTARGG